MHVHVLERFHCNNSLHCSESILCVFITDEDYTIVMERRLILSTEFPNATITIDIIDDGLPEQDEFFLVSLSFKDQVMIPRVTLDPSFANITIRGMRLKAVIRCIN